MPTWHPAALLRDETKKIDFIKDLQKVVEEFQENWNIDLFWESNLIFYKLSLTIIIWYTIKSFLLTKSCKQGKIFYRIKRVDIINSFLLYKKQYFILTIAYNFIYIKLASNKYIK